MKNYIRSYSSFINEARTKQWLDDVTDNKGNIRNVRIDNTIKIRVLEFIYEAGKEGRRYTEIVKFIVENIKGMVYDWRIHRGYWATNLTGAVGFFGGSDTGLLTQYCEKNEKGKWVLTNKKLIDYFMKVDFRGILGDEEREALAELLSIDN